MSQQNHRADTTEVGSRLDRQNFSEFFRDGIVSWKCLSVLAGKTQPQKFYRALPGPVYRLILLQSAKSVWVVQDGRTTTSGQSGTTSKTDGLEGPEHCSLPTPLQPAGTSLGVYLRRANNKQPWKV